MTIYNSWEDVPPVDQLELEDEVHYSSRLWKWDGQKWTLYSESSIGDINFKTEIPIEHTITTGNGDDVDVNHYFDLANLTPLKSDG